MCIRDRLHQAVKHLKHCKCKDMAGLTAELLKAGGDSIEKQMLVLFNDTVTSEQTPPEQWRHSTTSVI
eukprot:9283821-Pyramimonas_sp.AAC.2